VTTTTSPAEISISTELTKEVQTSTESIVVDRNRIPVVPEVESGLFDPIAANPNLNLSELERLHMEWHRKMDLQKQNEPKSTGIEPEEIENLQKEHEDYHEDYEGTDDEEFEDDGDDSTIEDYLYEGDKTPLSPKVEEKSVSSIKPQPLMSNEPIQSDADYSEPDFLSQILINTDLDHPEVYPENLILPVIEEEKDEEQHTKDPFLVPDEYEDIDRDDNDDRATTISTSTLTTSTTTSSTTTTTTTTSTTTTTTTFTSVAENKRTDSETTTLQFDHSDNVSFVMPKYPDVIAPSIFGKIDEKRGPRITKPPKSKYNQSMNKSVYFICQAIGNPTPDIIWLRNGVVVNVETNPNLYVYKGGDRSYLYLRRPFFTPDNKPDEYSCIAKNHFGTIRSQPALLQTRNRRQK